MEVSALSFTEKRIWISSLMEALAVDTVLAAGKCLVWLLKVTESLLTDVNHSVSPKFTRMDGRFPLDELLRGKHAFIGCKDASDEDEDDQDEEDADDQDDDDDDAGDEDFPGEGDEADPEANGAGGSDDGEEDDDEDGDDEEEEDVEEDDEEEEEEEEDEDDEEVPQPPAKKRK